MPSVAGKRRRDKIADDESGSDFETALQIYEEMTANLGDHREYEVVFVPASRIRPAPENDEVYRPVHEDDPAIQELAASIAELGLRDPIELSEDGYIISGHRRFCAAKVAGLTEFPVRYIRVTREHEPERFLKLLREGNRQRVKSADEQVREAVIDANPEECRSELINYRREKSKVRHTRLLLGEQRKRKQITSAKDDMVRAIQGVLEDRKEYWPLSDRQIHYAILNDPPLKHTKKPGSRYCNDADSYDSLTELLTRMRLTGLIPFEAIADETRPFEGWNVHREAGSFITDEVDNFLKGYWRNLMQSQPNHIEMVVEKNTVAGILKAVAAEFCIPVTSGRGYCSLPPRHNMLQRFRQSGKSKLVILLISDFDPDGEVIAESFARSMRDDFGVEDDALHPIKVALNFDQVKQFNLPKGLKAKKNSKHTPGFVKKYGHSVWELEALRPEQLQDLARKTIVDVLDLKAFEREQQAEANDAARLHAIRLAVQEHLKGVDLSVDDE